MNLPLTRHCGRSMTTGGDDGRCGSVDAPTGMRRGTNSYSPSARTTREKQSLRLGADGTHSDDTMASAATHPGPGVVLPSARAMLAAPSAARTSRSSASITARRRGTAERLEWSSMMIPPYGSTTMRRAAVLALWSGRAEHHDGAVRSSAPLDIRDDRMRADADLDRDRAEQEGAVRRAVQQPLQRKCDIVRSAMNRLAFVTSGIAGLLHAVPRFRAVGARVRAVLWSPRHLIDPHVIRVAAGGEGEERVLAERVQPVAGAFFVEQANELQFPLTVDRRVRFRADDERQVDARRRSVRACDLVGGRRGVGAQRRRRAGWRRDRIKAAATALSMSASKIAASGSAMIRCSAVRFIGRCPLRWFIDSSAYFDDGGSTSSRMSIKDDTGSCSNPGIGKKATPAASMPSKSAAVRKYRRSTSPTMQGSA